jgi:outer membrane protein assembly factor BamB
MNIIRIVKNVLCLILIIGIVACSSNKKKELKPVELESFDAEVELDTQWSRKIGSGLGEFYHQFILALDEKWIYAASENGKVFQMDKRSGKVQWKVSLDAVLTGGVAVDEQQVYVGTSGGVLIALDKNTGEQVWSEQLTSEIVSSPAAYNGHVVVQTSNGQVFDLDSENGDIRWRYDSIPPALTIRGNCRPIFLANYVVVGLGNGKLAVLDVDSGQLMWEPKVAEPKGDTEIGRIVDVDSTPLIVDQSLFAASYQGRIVAYDLKTGGLQWAADESTFRDLGYGFNGVLVSSADSIVTQYDTVSGSVKWANEDFLRRKLSAPVAVNNYVVVGDFEGYVHVLSQMDGHIVARKKVNGSGVRTPAIAEGMWFYVIANNGRLKAYEIIEDK